MAHDPDPGEAVEVKVIRLRRFVADFNRQYNWTPLLPEPLKNYIDRWNYCVDHNLVGQAHVVHSAGEDLPHNIRYCGCPFTCIKQPRSADSGYYPFQPQMMQRFLDDYNTIYSSELGPPAAIEFFSHVLGIFREVRDIDQEYIRDAFRAVGPDQVSNLYSVLFSLTPYSLAENRSFTEFPLRGPLPELVVDPSKIDWGPQESEIISMKTNRFVLPEPVLYSNQIVSNTIKNEFDLEPPRFNSLEYLRVRQRASDAMERLEKRAYEESQEEEKNKS